MDKPFYDELSENTEDGSTGDDRVQYLQLKTVSNIIVPQWNTSSIYGLVTAMVAAILAGVCYECLDDYAKHLYYRMLNRHRGTHCYGEDRFSCLEKFVQSVLLVVRMSLAYFMMMCVVTFNLWLLVSVVLGAAIGYGVGRPIITGVLKHPFLVATHGFHVVKVVRTSLKDTRVAQRSRSWRYQPINKHRADTSFREEQEASLSDDRTDSIESQTAEHDSMDLKVVWVKRTCEVEPNVSESQLHSDDDDIVFRQKPAVTAKSECESYTSLSRFKPASREINRSFRASNDDANRPPYRTMRQDADQASAGRVTRSASRASTTSVKSARRFKSVSKVISDERSNYRE